uniref:FRQ1-like protein n=1 Tax=Pfiesteria piscicida TaxID=71001 RepID=A3E3L0_PFIPI|nr:FRQ1-like protein [Pfiesteria piscicida]
MSLWQLLDKDGNGVVSRAEWQDAFKSLDADGDGRITRKEFAAFTESNHLFDAIPKKKSIAVVTAQDWDLFFEALDTDGNGDLSFDELKAIDVDDETPQSVTDKIKQFERQAGGQGARGAPTAAPTLKKSEPQPGTSEAPTLKKSEPQPGTSEAPTLTKSEPQPGTSEAATLKKSEPQPGTSEAYPLSPTSPSQPLSPVSSSSPASARVRTSIRNSVIVGLDGDVLERYTQQRVFVAAAFKKPKKESDTQRIKLDALRDQIEKGDPPSKRPDASAHILFKKEDEEWRRVCKLAKASNWSKEDLAQRYIELAQAILSEQ